jgi:site-specific DNA-methyltransferase (adenine-specific)
MTTHGVKYLIGDTREQIATIPDGSISLVATSPPFIALRSYLPADHPMKHAEIGSEPDPATFLDTLLALTAEWGRVLAPWGSIAIELGDTYAGGGGLVESREHRTEREGTGADGGARFVVKTGNWPRPKCLALVPQLYAASLAYGRNLLTGEPSPAGQWLVRNMIVWHRPNPAVGALGDKYRPSTSYITVATRSPKRWFDLTAVRTALKVPEAATLEGARPISVNMGKGKNGTDAQNVGLKIAMSNAAGAPPLDAWFDEHDTWTMTTQPSSLAHYAMWPAKLAERLILSMCPAEVCATCGEPRRRVERSTPSVDGVVGKIVGFSNGLNATHGNYDQVGGTFATCKTTLGWTDCGHDNFVPGHVLDPFGGTGTTGAVAHLHGRDATLIDIDERNANMYPARLDECRRTLFGVKPELPGQEALFG